MRFSNQVFIRCENCGQVYHVPRASVDRSAKCRPCGHEFVIPAAVVDVSSRLHRTGSPGHAVEDRVTAARMATMRVGKRKSQVLKKKNILATAVAMCAFTALILTTRGLIPTTNNLAAKSLNAGMMPTSLARPSVRQFETATQLVEAIEPAVVQIGTPGGFGSGFVLDQSGLIVTCHHCIADAFQAEVIFADGKRVPVLGTVRTARNCDIAVLKIAPFKSLVSLPLIRHDPKKGERVITIGSPGGLAFSVSDGTVGGLRTAGELASLDGVFRTPTGLSPRVNLVQVTAPLMPGNSGGPVVDFSGNVIGIGSFVFNWHGQMFHFCISASEIRKVLDDLDDEVTPLWEPEHDFGLHRIFEDLGRHDGRRIDMPVKPLPSRGNAEQSGIGAVAVP
jgi:S1-C subfamily serine protease